MHPKDRFEEVCRPKQSQFHFFSCRVREVHVTVSGGGQRDLEKLISQSLLSFFLTVLGTEW